MAGASALGSYLSPMRSPRCRAIELRTGRRRPVDGLDAHEKNVGLLGLIVLRRHDDQAHLLAGWVLDEKANLADLRDALIGAADAGGFVALIPAGGGH